eukprot:m.136634 g.136634  ORF g.136634 m.136634 type:complete len:223 (-) comp10788_c0_seq1:1164-1832(-)
MSHKDVKFVEATGRGAVVEDLAKRARDRARKEEEELQRKADAKKNPVKRENLKARDFAVDLKSTLGKSRVVVSTNSKDSGYFCEVCDCVLKDSTSYLDHINGIKHQKNLGMSMRVEKSSVDQVKKRLEMLKKKKMEAQRKTKIHYSLDEQVVQQQQQDAERKKAKRNKQKQKKQDEEDKYWSKKAKKSESKGDDDSEDDEEGDNDSTANDAMAKMMGFASFQ